MSDKAKEKEIIRALQELAGMVSHNLSLERMLTTFLGKVSDATWAKIFQNSPVWYELYFKTPGELCQALFLQSKTAREALVCDPEIKEPHRGFQALLEKASSTFKEIATLAKELEAETRQVEFDLDVEETKQVLEEMVLGKALLAEIRARAFYGQGMLSFIAAGQNGNDEGYFRAASIDPTIQWHPAIAERVSRDALVGKTTFAEGLQRAAKMGPSKNIDVDLHQLRYMLGLMRELSLLDEMSKEVRFELFYKQLQLYPGIGSKAGRDVKSSLCTFIKRWEESLVV